MKDRIKELRKAEGLTQQEFAERLGIKRAAVSNYEIGRNVPVDSVVSLICREFHVREAWLRTGEEPMREPEPVDEVGEIVRRAGVSPDGERLLRLVLSFDERTQTAIVDKMVELFGNSDRLSHPPESPQSAMDGEGVSIPPEADTSGLSEAQRVELAEIERQMRLQNEVAAKSSASQSGSGATVKNQ